MEAIKTEPQRLDLAVDRRTARNSASLLRRLTPPPILTLPEWAEKYRRLSPESSMEPGRWNNDRARYQYGMMLALSDPRIEQVVLMTSARIGKTQSCINNLIGMHCSTDPCNMMIVLPTEQRADEWADDEFDPMIRDTPILRDIFGLRKSRTAKDRRKHRTFPGGRLYMVGANAPSGLAAKTIRVLCCDEIDRFPISSGREGDPVDMAIRRCNTAWNRKIVLSSTPTISGSSRIERAYQDSDRRRYWVPCPHCETMQTLRWENVRWQNDDARTAAYYCEDCGAAWTDAQRWSAVRRGEWRAEAPFNGVAGFHLNELASPWRRVAETVTDFLKAKVGGVEQLKVWKNTALGEVWQEAGEAPDWERLAERRERLDMGVVPAQALVLTAGIDNQAAPERLEMAVWAWAPGYESWLVDTIALPGSPATAEPWNAVAALMSKDWPQEGGGTMRIAKAAADTGGQHTAGVYAQLRRLRDPRILPIKGVPGWNKASPVAGPTFVDVTAGGKKIPRGLKLWTVAVDVFKADLYRRLWLGRGDSEGFPPGWVHLPDGLEGEQVKQLVAEQLVTMKDRRGFARQEWQKLRANEQLDMAVYARGALSVLGSDRYGERFWKSLAPALASPPQASEPVVEQQMSLVTAQPEPAAPTVAVHLPPGRRSLANRLA